MQRCRGFQTRATVLFAEAKKPAAKGAKGGKEEAPPRERKTRLPDSKFVKDRETYNAQTKVVRRKYFVERSEKANAAKIEEKNNKIAIKAKEAKNATNVLKNMEDEDLTALLKKMGTRFEEISEWKKERETMRASVPTFNQRNQQYFSLLESAVHSFSEKSSTYLTSDNDDEILHFVSSRIGEGINPPAPLHLTHSLLEKTAANAGAKASALGAVGVFANGSDAGVTTTPVPPKPNDAT